MSVIRTIHGELRWIVAIVAIVIIIKFLVGWLGKREYQSLDRTLLVVFSSLMDLNLLLGLILLFTMGLSGMARIEHTVTMILAVVAAHLTALWRNTEDSSIKYRNQLLMVVLSLVFVILGVIRIRGALYAQGFF